MTDNALVVRRLGNSVAMQQMGKRTIGKLEPPTRLTGVLVASLIVIAVFFGGFGAWAVVAPLKSAVISIGVVKVVGDRDIVQHLEGGIVREVLVRQDDQVEAGQVLLRMDPTRNSAEIEIIRGQLLSMLAREARLTAEQFGRKDIIIDEAIAPEAVGDPKFQPYLEAQTEVLLQRRTTLSGEIAVLDERIDQLEEEISGLNSQIGSQNEQLRLAAIELADAETLLEKQLTRKSSVLRLRRGIANINGQISVNRARIARGRQQISESEERKLLAQRRVMDEVTTEKQRVQDRIFELRQQLRALYDVRDRLEVKAPRAGTVVDLQVRNPGVVIQRGQMLIEILPDDPELIVEVQIRPTDIEAVRNGLSARVRLTAFDMRRVAPIEGEVKQVSADRLVDPDTGQPFYRGLVSLDLRDIEANADIDLVPGMPAEVMIETGESTLATYLLGPIVDNLNRGLREN